MTPSDQRFITLNDGKQVPRVAFGSGTAWIQANGTDALVQATLKATEIGYDHLDTAKYYANEKLVGAAISQSGIPRHKLFVTTKLHEIAQVSSIERTLKEQLKDLKIDYVDLYLIHTPLFAPAGGQSNSGSTERVGLQEAWKEMERLRSTGLAKSIGVSNYRISDLEEILKSATVKPAVNQIEFHPYVWKEAEALLKFMNKEGIVLEAYGSQVPMVKLAGGKLDPILERIASTKKHADGSGNLTPAEILLKWAKAHGAIVVTTSSKPERMRSNLKTVLESHNDLSEEEVSEIDRFGSESTVQRIYMKHMSQ